MTLRLNGSTSGYVELDAPAVAGTSALTLPAVTGTLLTAEGGKVLQVVRATDTTFRSTTSTSYVDVTGMSVTITPQKSTSTILVICSATCSRDSANNGAYFQLTDSSNNALSGAEECLVYHNSTSLLRVSQTFVGYVTPATTSPVTYKARFKVDAGANAQMNNNARTGQMYAIEVSA